MTFSRSKNPLLFDYQINGNSLCAVDKVKVVGVIIDSTFCFTSHINYITSLTYKKLGWIKRLTKDFTDPLVIKLFFNSFVLPHLNFASPVWKPYNLNLKSKLEGVNHQLLRYLAFKSGNPMSYIDHNYREVSILFSVSTIELQHKINDAVFSFKLYKGLIPYQHLFLEIELTLLGTGDQLWRQLLVKSTHFR